MKRKPDVLLILVILFSLGVVTTGYTQSLWERQPAPVVQSKVAGSGAHVPQGTRYGLIPSIPRLIRDGALQRHIPAGHGQSIHLLTFMRQSQ